MEMMLLMRELNKIYNLPKQNQSMTPNNPVRKVKVVLLQMEDKSCHNKIH